MPDGAGSPARVAGREAAEAVARCAGSPAAGSPAKTPPKRLSFGGAAAHAVELPPETTEQHLAELARAVQAPSLASFRGAGAALEGLTNSKFDMVVRVARENGATSGPSELQRLKEEFRSLKATFQELDTKEAFIDALEEGRPNGTELEVLQNARDAAAESAQALKRVKQDNADLKEELEFLICNVCEEFERYNRSKAELADCLSHLEGVEAQKQAKLEEVHRAAGGKRKEACEEELAAILAEEAELEARVADKGAECDALAREVGGLERDIADVEAHVELAARTLEQARRAQEQGSKLRQNYEWAEAFAGVLEEISGLAILEHGPQSLKLRMRTYPAPAPDHWEYLPQVHDLPPVEHELTLKLAGAGAGGGTVVGVEVFPDTIPMRDVLEATVGHCGPDTVVREVQARVASYTTRLALLKAAAQARPVRWGFSSKLPKETCVSISFPGGCEVVLDLPYWWPEGGTELAVHSVEGEALTPETRARIFAALAEAPRIRGLSLARFAEHVETVLKEFL